MNKTFFANYLRDRNTWELIATVYADFPMEVDEMLDELGWTVQADDYLDPIGELGECLDEHLNKTGIYYYDLEVYTEEQERE